jgi:23S rRNA pseudouridine1911/1915/1917 synthase
MKLDIIFENNDFIVLNKTSGMLSIPDREGIEISLKKILQEKYITIFTVHRLDKDTSGIILFAKNETTHKTLSKLFESRLVEKFYIGIVMGTLYQKEGTINAPIAEHAFKAGFMTIHKRGKESVTDYKVLEEFKYFSLVQFQIHTGRTHQIRIHMKHIETPIVCDEFYGSTSPILLSSFKKKFKLSKTDEEERPLLNRLALHSWKISFTLNKEHFSFEAPLQKDMQVTLQQLRKWAT